MVANFGGGVPALERTGGDGWQIADPLPMSRRTRRAFQGLIRAVLPPAPAPRGPEMVERIEVHARRLLRYMPRTVQIALPLAFRALEWVPRVLFASARRLSALTPATANELLERFGALAVPFRELVWAVRGIILSVYFDQDEVHEEMRYAPGTWMRSRIALRQRMLGGSGFGLGDMVPAHAIAGAPLPLLPDVAGASLSEFLDDESLEAAE